MIIIIHVIIIAYLQISDSHQCTFMNEYQWKFTSIFLSCKYVFLFSFDSQYILIYLYYYFISYSVHFWHWKRIVGLDWPRIHPCWIEECYATCSCKDHYTSSHTRTHTHTLALYWDFQKWLKQKMLDFAIITFLIQLNKSSNFLDV